MTEFVDRKQLQMIIAGLSEGVIIIETDQRITWANESALFMHGVTNLSQLGRTVDDYRNNFRLRYRNNHILEQEQYPADRVVAGEVFVDVIVLVSPAADADQEWVHQIRSLVITDKDDQPDCLVLVIADVTERFAAEARFERTFNANPAPAIICRLSDQVVVKVNQGFLEMLSLAKDEILAHPIADIDLFAEAPNPESLLQRLVEGLTIPQTETMLRLPAGGRKLVIMAGQPIEVGDEACMLFTFADLDAREKAESALRQSEERFSKAFQLSPVATALLKLTDRTFLSINAAFASQFGYTDAELIGRRPEDLHLWARADAGQQFSTEIVQTGTVSSLEACMMCKNKNELDCIVSAETVTIGEHKCILATFLDITERKRTERELMAAIDAAMADASWLSRGIIEKLAAHRRQRSDSVDQKHLTTRKLTNREREVLGLICQGMSDPAISKHLSLSLNTVRNHVASMYRKLGLHRRSDAVIWGRENGFMSK
jgi:PAS domain S-box-containing protein